MERFGFDKYLESKTSTLSPVSEKKDLATEIHESFKLPFWRIYKMIQRNGIQCTRECFLESKKEGKNPAALFIYLMKKNETKFV